MIGLKLKEAKDLCIKDPALKDPVVPHKNLHANHTRYNKYYRFSTGPASYLFDILSPIFEKSFATEAANDFTAFSELKE